MKGSDFVRIVERQLVTRGITKGQFYKDCNITSSTFSNWRNNENTPTPRNIQIVSEYFGIQIDNEGVPETDETVGMRELLRERQDLRVLLNSAKDVPASSVYALISQIEKMKEGNK